MPEAGLSPETIIGLIQGVSLIAVSHDYDRPLKM
jgi:hypothetical protein